MVKQEVKKETVTVKLEVVESEEELKDRARSAFSHHFDDIENRFFLNPPAMDECQSSSWETKLLQLAEEKLHILGANEIYDTAEKDDSRSVSVVFPAIKDKLSSPKLGKALITLMKSEFPDTDQVKEVVVLGVSASIMKRAVELVVKQLAKVPGHESLKGPLKMDNEGYYYHTAPPLTWLPCYDPSYIHGNPGRDDGSRNYGRAEMCLNLFQAFVDAGAVVSEKSSRWIENGLELWNPMLYSSERRPGNRYSSWHREGIQHIVECLWKMKHYPSAPASALPPHTLGRPIRNTFGFEVASASSSEKQNAIAQARSGLPRMFVEKYSANSIAVFGDTYDHYDVFKSMKGIYNKNLKRNGVRTPGWILYNNKRSAVERYISRCK